MKKSKFRYLVVFHFGQCRIIKEIQQLFADGRPFLMQAAGVVIITFRKAQQTRGVFVHPFHRFNDRGEINAVGVPRKDISPFPSPDAFDEPGLGEGGQQLPQIFIRDVQCLNKVLGREYLHIGVDHITQHPDRILGCLGQDH